MDPRSHGFRVAALLAAGAVAVHQLRYLTAYGHESPVALAGQGHAYLSIAAPAVGVLVCLAVAAFGARLLDARRSPAPEHETPRPGPLWALSSLSLLVIYGFQESLEGQLEPGHPAGIAGIFGHGGWTAILLAIAIGGLVALVARGASGAIEHATRSRLRSVPRALELRGPPLPVPRVALDPIAGHLAGRGPPIACR
jgi:hypothetical protein